MRLHSEWAQHLSRLIYQGEAVGPRGQATRELLDQQLTIDSRYNLLDVPGRKLNFRFAVAEWVWMMFGHSDVGSIAQYNSVMRQFSDDDMFLTGAYGPHINAQRFRILRRLREDPATRQAVIEIPRPQVYHTKDEPCTLSLQFLLRHNELNLIATMRSSDAWLGIPYDVFTFTQIQNCYAGELGVKRGWLSLRMGSAHLYERDIDAALRLLTGPKDLDTTTIASPDLPGLPPAWLEKVFRTRDAAAIPELTDSEEIELIIYARDITPWLPYAYAMLADTSIDARRHLTRAVGR